MSRSGRRRRLAATGLVIAALIVVACGSTAAPSPSPSAGATPTAIPVPTASPSPADVSAVFLKAITAPDFSAAETFSGTIAVGGKDTYLLSGQGRVYVATTAYKGSTAGFASALKVSYRKPFGGDPSSETQRTLGGEAALRLAYQYRNAAGQDSFIVDDVTTRGGNGWEVFLATPGGTEDVAIFNQFAATFTFTK